MGLAAQIPWRASAKLDQEGSSVNLLRQLGCFEARVIHGADIARLHLHLEGSPGHELKRLKRAVLEGTRLAVWKVCHSKGADAGS